MSLKRDKRQFDEIWEEKRQIVSATPPHGKRQPALYRCASEGNVNISRQALSSIAHPKKRRLLVAYMEDGTCGELRV